MPDLRLAGGLVQKKSMTTLQNQIRKITDDRERALVVRVAIAALNDQLVYESAQIGGSWIARLTRGAVVAMLGRTIQSLREHFPESDDYMPSIPNVEYTSKDNTNYE